MDYAIIETGGKQYTVRPGDTLRVDKLPHDQDDSLELDRVLLLSRDGVVKVGQPLVEGASVKAEVVENGRARKITVLRFKPKVRYKRKTGHRQHYTELRITEIVEGE